MKHPSRVGLLALVLFAGSLKPASAAPISFNFSGSIDLSNFGGSSSSAFGGSFVWDTAAAPVGTMGSDTTLYALTSESFTLNAVNLTSRITTPMFSVTNSPSGDAFSFGWAFSPAVNVGPGVDITMFGATLNLPISIFASEAAPANASFLASVTSAGSVMYGAPPSTTGFGSLSVTKTIPNPEPGSLILLGSGIISAAFAGARRRARGKRTTA